MRAKARGSARCDEDVLERLDETLELSVAVEERLARRLLGVVYGSEEPAPEELLDEVVDALPPVEAMQVTLPVDVLDSIPCLEQERLDTADLFDAFMARLQPAERAIVRGRLDGRSPREIGLAAYPGRTPRAARDAVVRDLARIWGKWRTFVCR